MKTSKISKPTEGTKVPPKYDLRMSQLADLYQMVEDGGSNGVFDAIASAYALGFKRGRNYERNKTKAHKAS